ncbi:MAG TPA: cysteine hydrolase [Caulobacteraceae bacterium]|nr:cysteine hydrolase [Caulobacteraceae bacterium]
MLAKTLAPRRTALLAIDLQRDFVAPDGRLASSGADLSSVEPALARIGRLLDAARRAGVSVGFARVETRASTDSAALKALNQRHGAPAEATEICRAGTPGAAFFGVAPAAGEIVVSKRLYDAFHETTLEAELRARRVEALVIVGVATDCCIDATARAAFHRGFHVVVLEDATAGYDASLHLASLTALSRHCASVVTSAEVMEAWGGAAPGLPPAASDG